MSTHINTPIGVLLMAYGSPEKLTDVKAYYTDIRGGKTPSSNLIEDVKSRYMAVGGKTPLNSITIEQSISLYKILNQKFPGRYCVYQGMKHWHPYISVTVKKIKKDKIKQLIALVLAPHYSKMSVGGYRKKLEDALDAQNYHPQLNFINSWYSQPLLIESIVQQIKHALTQHFPTSSLSNVHLVFTAHSLPERILTTGDPYRKQLLETSRLVAHKIGTKNWSFSFQSAGHTNEPWLGPDISDHLKDLTKQGVKRVLICPIGFVSDNLEILYDLDIEAKKVAHKLSVIYVRCESRNTHPLFIQALAELVIGSHN